MKYLIALLFCFTLAAQQTVNNFTVKTNLTAQGAPVSLVVSNVAQMRGLTAIQDGQKVSTLGRTVVGYGGGDFVWNASSTASTNLGTIFNLTSGGVGRFQYVGTTPGDIRIWGALPDGVIAGGTNVDVNIQAAINYLSASTFGGSKKQQITIPSGYWRLANTLTITNTIAIAGEAIEKNSVNVDDYNLNGSVLKSYITGGNAVIRVVGENVGGNTYIQGVELKDFGIDGSGSEGPGIWLDCTSNLSDVYLSRLIVRNVGGSAYKGGDGTQSGSPRYGYSTFEELTAIYPGLDGFEFYCESLDTVNMRWCGLYVNGAGRHSFNFWNMGSFYAERWIENNSGQIQSGNGFNLVNIKNAVFNNFYVEGDGRNQQSGGSYTPLTSSVGMKLQGVSQSTFIGGVAISPSGSIGSLTNSGVVELVTSTSTNGFGSRESTGNRFINQTIVGYAETISAPSASASGSSGSLSTGIYRYRVSGVYSGFETPITSSTETIVSVTASNTVSLTSIPVITTPLGTNVATARKIWRTVANGNTFKLLTTISNNIATTYSDTTSDASLGADADFPWLILFDSNSSMNQFDGCNFATFPLVKDNGSRNTFFNNFISTIPPSSKPNAGSGSWNNTFSSGQLGQRHFFGADSSGAYTGYALTAGNPKRASIVIPSYSSSRFSQNQSTLIDGQSTSSANTINVGGGNSNDYAATEVGLYAASNSTTTTGTKQVTITSSGTAFETAVDFNAASTVDVAFTYSAAPILNNNVFLRSKDSGGTTRDLIGKSSGDIVVIGSGSGSERINITAGTGGLFLGTPGVTSSIYVPRSNFASSGNTTRDSQIFGYVASYWNGSSEVQVDATTRLSMDSTSPAYSLYWNLGGNDRLQLKNDGTLNVATGPIQLVTVTIASGSGTPEGAVTAPVGSLYLRTNGGAGTTLYIKESGTGNTGWVGK